MNATTAIPTRFRLRAGAEQAGMSTALGGPLPHGRRIAVWVRDGVAVADADDSARWRGQLLLRESPAALDAELRRELHRLAQRCASNAGCQGLVRVMLVLTDDHAPHLVDVDVADGRAHDESAPPDDRPGCSLSAWLRAGEPAVGRTGPCTALVTGVTLPPGSSHALTAGAIFTGDHGQVLTVLRGVGADRKAALTALRAMIAEVRIDGLPSNLHVLRAMLADARLDTGLSAARDLEDLVYTPPLIEVLAPGTHTTIQEHPGRLGYWAVGVPPSGPMDDLAFRLANRLVGNDPGTAALEMTLTGPNLRFLAPAIICLAGPPYAATLDGAPLPMWRAVAVPAGAVLRCGGPEDTGCRATLALRHGLAVPEYLGSRATFDLGGFGGLTGRALSAGDLLPLARPAGPDELAACPPPLTAQARPAYTRTWRLAVTEGPHAAPDFFQAADLRELYATAWRVHHNSNRTGVRLIGPKPRWARSDGGEAGLHPSNIHDNAYAIGAIDFTGDMPILLGPDGPSCGGFVCPAVVVTAERWKLGQLRPGDTVRFVRVSQAEAGAARAERRRLIAGGPARRSPPQPATVPEDAIRLRHRAAINRPALCLRQSGDAYLLLEYGEHVLDLALRLRVHLLEQALKARGERGIIDITPGIRSLQIHLDPDVLPIDTLMDLLVKLDADLPSLDEVEVPTRTVHLPLSWDDPATRKAIDIYMRSVRADAPWCPSNLEFIRRINGLDSIDAVKRIVFAADYLVMGLGDVYLGAPVATPLDPRHRLVTTKYNPARTWTPPNAVGIGGAYLCIYGMEGPGGYQFVGRTIPVWNTWTTTPEFLPGTPWLLRSFDILKWYEVEADELMTLRAAAHAGQLRLRIEPGRLRWRDVRDRLDRDAADIARFQSTQRAAFAAERERWGDTR